jgi:hypothetical protein
VVVIQFLKQKLVCSKKKIKKQITMKNFLFGCVLSTLGGVSAFDPLPITNERMSQSYNFLVHGDWGWNSFNQSLTAYEMGVYGWITDAQFVIALGDNFYNDGTESTEDELWETAFHDVYYAPSQNVPWYGVLGNHGLYHAELKYIVPFLIKGLIHL